MKDIHTHLLFGVDDGSKSLETSVDLIKKLENNNIKEIILTPHYIESSNYQENNKDKKEKFKKLKTRLKKENINVKLYLGNEVYITTNFIDLIKKNEIMTLNNSRYLLIELPMHSKINGINEILFNLISIGCIPILAHPERYSYLTIEDLTDLIKMGTILQCNYPSLYNYYGKDVKNKAKLLFKKHMVHLIGSDTHSNEIKIKFKKLKKCLKKLIKNEEILNDVLENNFNKVINNELIVPYDIK